MILKKIIILILIIMTMIFTTGMAEAQDSFATKEWNYYYSNDGEDFYWIYRGRERGNIQLVWVKRTLASDKVRPGGVQTVLYLFGFNFRHHMVTRYCIKTYTTDGYEEEVPDYRNLWRQIEHSPEYIKELVPWIVKAAEFEY